MKVLLPKNISKGNENTEGAAIIAGLVPESRLAGIQGRENFFTDSREICILLGAG